MHHTFLAFFAVLLTSLAFVDAAEPSASSSHVLWFTQPAKTGNADD
jgi:hypothetical protein